MEESYHGASRDLAGVRRGNGREKRTMNMLDVDAIRAQVRALDFTRGTPADAAMRREDDADARANLAIEGMALDAGEHALFDMLREEAARSTATKPAYRRSEEHTSELQSLMRISYAVFCLKKQINN